MNTTAMPRPTLLRVTVHQLAAVAVEADVDLQAAVLVAGWASGDLVAGDDHPTLQLDRRAAFLAELEGFGAGPGGVQLGGGADQVGGLAEVRLASAVSTCTPGSSTTMRLAPWLRQRLRRRPALSLVAHGGEVLLDRILADLRQLGGRQRQTPAWASKSGKSLRIRR